jgi:hypothetical protein
MDELTYDALERAYQEAWSGHEEPDVIAWTLEGVRYGAASGIEVADEVKDFLERTKDLPGDEVVIIHKGHIELYDG